MNEVALSNSIERLETEIEFFKQQAGQSIWEIGRRLNHVKEHDLVHGEFLKWLEKMQIDHTAAKRMMKVSNELPNSSTLHHLGTSALYLIATLPETEREVEHVTADGESKKPDEMTVRELQELKKKIKVKDDFINQTLENVDRIRKKTTELQKENNELKSREPEIKIVEKKVMHPHVNDLRSDNEQLSKTLKTVRAEADAVKKRNEFIEKEYNKLINQRKEVKEKSRRYEELTEGIHKLEGKMDDNQRMLTSHKNVVDTIRAGNELLDRLSGLVYATDIEDLKENELVAKELNKLIGRVEWWLNDINKKVNSTTILEGEIIND